MSTDRELLELAARAAGWTVGFITSDSAPDEILSVVVDTGKKIFGPWNPLTDDGDALRLAVKLCLLVDCYSHCARPLPDSLAWEEGSGLDACANTRRAIVKAAAEIGRSMA